MKKEEIVTSTEKKSTLEKTAKWATIVVSVATIVSEIVEVIGKAKE